MQHPWSSQIVLNNKKRREVDRYGGVYVTELIREGVDLSRRVDGLFVWARTPQGHNYWSRIAHGDIL